MTTNKTWDTTSPPLPDEKKTPDWWEREALEAEAPASTDLDAEVYEEVYEEWDGVLHEFRIVDSVSALEPRSISQAEWAAIAKAAQELKKMAMDLEVPVMVIHDEVVYDRRTLDSLEHQTDLVREATALQDSVFAEMIRDQLPEASFAARWADLCYDAALDQES